MRRRKCERILLTLREAFQTRSLSKISSKCLDVDATLQQSRASRCPAMHCHHHQTRLTPQRYFAAQHSEEKILTLDDQNHAESKGVAKPGNGNAPPPRSRQ